MITCVHVLHPIGWVYCLMQPLQGVVCQQNSSWWSHRNDPRNSSTPMEIIQHKRINLNVYTSSNSDNGYNTNNNLRWATIHLTDRTRNHSRIILWFNAYFHYNHPNRTNLRLWPLFFIYFYQKTINMTNPVIWCSTSSTSKGTLCGRNLFKKYVKTGSKKIFHL